MGGLRFLPLVAVAACANLSGLNELEVDAQSDAQQDAGGDEAIAETSTDSPADSVADGADAGTFCTTQTQSWLWCADFDEKDVAQGFLNGTPTPWTTVTGVALSAMFASPPASARFDGASKEFLAFTHGPTNLTTLEVTGQLQVTTTTLTGDSAVLVLVLAQNYSLKLVAGTASSQGFTLSFNEVTELVDGGTQSTNHPLGNFGTGTWIFVDAQVTATAVAITAGNTAKASFAHAGQQSQLVSVVLGFDLNWTGNWDSIRANF